MPIGPCNQGYHVRRSYTMKHGKRVATGCVKNPRGAVAAAAAAAATQKAKNCPPGQTRRASYIRHISSGVVEHGYSVHKKNGKTYRVYPKKRGSIRVRSACVGTKKLSPRRSPVRIPILRHGALKKYGYSYKFSTPVRRLALQKAVIAYGALNVYHKLDAVAKLAVTNAPAASRIFRADRDWVRQMYKKVSHV